MHKFGVRAVADLVKLAERAGLGAVPDGYRRTAAPAARPTWTKVQ